MSDVLGVQFSLECYSSHVWQKKIKSIVNLLQNQYSSHCAIQYLPVHGYISVVESNELTDQIFIQCPVL